MTPLSQAASSDAHHDGHPAISDIRVNCLRTYLQVKQDSPLGAEKLVLKVCSGRIMVRQQQDDLTAHSAYKQDEGSNLKLVRKTSEPHGFGDAKINGLRFQIYWPLQSTEKPSCRRKQLGTINYQDGKSLQAHKYLLNIQMIYFIIFG